MSSGNAVQAEGAKKEGGAAAGGKRGVAGAAAADARPMARRHMHLLGSYHIVMIMVFLVLLYRFWIGSDGGDAAGGAPATPARILLLVVLAGGLGSFIHSASSFATYAGNRKLYASWGWWYALRPAIGMALAVVFYLVIRGGLVAVGAAPDPAAGVNVYAVTAIAALVGMFSKQAADKLNDVFDALFKTDQDAHRADKLQNPTPSVTALEPDTVTADPKGAAEVSVTVRGKGFVPESVVRVDGSDRETSFVGAGELSVKLDPVDLSTTGPRPVTVYNPPPGGGTSNEATLTVAEPAPAPAVG